MGEQNLKTFENALKYNYLPVWNNQLGIAPSALLAKIKKEKLVSDMIRATAPIGLSGGFGFGEEGKDTPAAGNVNFEQFNVRSKDMYVNIAISQKAVDLTGTGGAMANALDTEVKAAYDTAKWNVGRSLFGDGTGKLAIVKSASTTSVATLKVDDYTKLKEGLIIDIYASGSTSASTPTIAGARISQINRTADSNGYYTVTLSSNLSSAVAANAFIVVQGSFGHEITGLGAIFDDNILSVYGLSKSDKPFLKPTVIDAESYVDDDIIWEGLTKSERDKNGKVDTLLMSDTSFRAYVKYMRDNNIRVEEQSHTLNGGFKAIKYLFGTREVDIVNEQFVPADEVWGVDSKSLTFHHTDWDFAQLNGSSIFNLMPTKSVYRALLRNYGDLICNNPGGCIRFTNFKETVETATDDTNT